jgi:predicted ATP-dependent endonuclease of OLD family
MLENQDDVLRYINEHIKTRYRYVSSNTQHKENKVHKTKKELHERFSSCFVALYEELV